jgi:hypothetical protein
MTLLLSYLAPELVMQSSDLLTSLDDGTPCDPDFSKAVVYQGCAAVALHLGEGC